MNTIMQICWGDTHCYIWKDLKWCELPLPQCLGVSCCTKRSKNRIHTAGFSQVPSATWSCSLHCRMRHAGSHARPLSQASQKMKLGTVTFDFVAIVISQLSAVWLPPRAACTALWVADWMEPLDFAEMNENALKRKLSLGKQRKTAAQCDSRLQESLVRML